MSAKSRILVVEDDRIIAMEIKERLEEYNYDVVSIAHNGIAAIEMAAEFSPELIIMDIHLEGEMDGIEAAMQIKSKSGIPVVYLTAYADDNTIERAKITEPYGYIVKPLDERELKSAVEIALYKQTSEKKLKDSESRYRAIVNTIEGSLFLVNSDREITFSNRCFSDNYEGKDSGSKCFKVLFNYDKPCDHCMMPEVLNGKTTRTEIYDKNTGRWYYLLNSPVELSSGEVYNQHLMMDITVQKKNEEALLNLLKDKELLLREVHHRVKNNLQMMLSLIRLQSAETTDMIAKEKLTTFENRLYSLSLLHEDLYVSNNMGKIKFSNYLKKLTAHLSHAFMISSNTISIKIEAEHFYLEPEIAIPCGVILNELITNSFKYAFPDNSKGEININMKKVDENYELIYSDTGVGLHKDINIKKSKTLGLQLIDTLSSQLGNNPVIKNQNGLQYEFLIKPVKQKNRMVNPN